MTNTEKLFQVLDDSSEIIENAVGVTYLEALAESGENLFQQAVLQQLSAEEKKQLEDLYKQVQVEEMKAEEIRKAFQLAVLKGMKAATQPNHEMTPDAVALFVGYLVNKLTAGMESLSMLDTPVG
jgi:site-specific DNA-methyltransferase (adenine-specific)